MITKTQTLIASTMFFVAVYLIHAIGGIDTVFRRIISAIFELN